MSLNCVGAEDGQICDVCNEPFEVGETIFEQNGVFFHSYTCGFASLEVRNKMSPPADNTKPLPSRKVVVSAMADKSASSGFVNPMERVRGDISEVGGV